MAVTKHTVKTSKVPLSKMKIHNPVEYKAYKAGRGNAKLDLAKQVMAKHNIKMKGV